jgi:hypothetical protein
MGFYIRKSLSVGPFRFNLSKSGIGVSTGIRGFRVGMGPRGNYIHMGRGGLYFRTSIPDHAHPIPKTQPLTPSIPVADGLEEIESGSTLLMVDSSSATLLQEINSKAKKFRLWPVTVTASILVLLVMAGLQAPVWALCVLGVACFGGIYTALLRDRLKKTVVLFYQMEPHLEKCYQTLHDSFDRMRSCKKTWHVEGRGDVHGLYEWKTSGGADTIVRRKSIGFYPGTPRYFKANILVPVIPAGRQTLYFFPDRLLVYGPEGVGAVAYDALEIGWAEARFIETGGVPSDASIVDKTWHYVNKSGKPDRRYKDNSEIPIALYGAVQFTSSSGLKELFQLSRPGLGQGFEAAVRELADALNSPETPAAAFMTCPCNSCSGHIEFPADAVGQNVGCPHCGLDTILFEPSASK